ncbi:hypothetical protein NQ314_010410 [Rhamnusium bicolor]|uniref:Uncharacterized protein n=1 Tax=Rhamnusium bicolor TaxID=1586634 RepID=A0AAV8XRY7_9CUCU|nr:hypothetical protein NQ314_010410 [Rhamnusium bicolor]
MTELATLNLCRKYLPKEVIAKKLEKHEYIGRETHDGNFVSKWKDARDVLMLSTIHNMDKRVPPPSSKRKRKIVPPPTGHNETPAQKRRRTDENKTPKLKPAAIIAYNNDKCGIDKSDV